MKAEPQEFCSCATGSLEFYKSQGTKLNQPRDAKTLSYVLKEAQYCQDVCVRDTDGTFWKNKDSNTLILWIGPICLDPSDPSTCNHHVDVDTGILQSQDADETEVDTNDCTRANPHTETNCFLKLTAISCRGCGPIKGDLIKESECFDEPALAK